MSTTALDKRIQLLPDELKKQVADFVEFLIIKYQVGKKEEELTKDQKQELKKLWSAYENDPDNVIPMDIALKETKTKYGL